MASCKICHEHDVGYYIWKIPSVSSIPHVVGHVVQSPSFSFEETFWTLKMYPNGDSSENDGFTSLSIERLEARSDIMCWLSYKNFFNNKIHLKYAELSNSEKEESIPRLMKNLKEISQDPECVLNDTLYLVVELRRILDTSSDSVSPTISSTGTIDTTDRNENVVGEIFKEYEGSEWFVFIISDIPGGLPSDYHIDSPQLSFLKAKWTLKLRPYHRMENSQKANFDIVLERMESQVPVHNVKLKICNYFDRAKKEEFLTFDSRSAQSPAFEFQLKKLDEPNLALSIEVKQLKSTRICLEPQKKSAEKSTVDENKTESSSSPSVSMMSLRIKALQDYKKLFFQKEHCDVTFKVQEKELRAHSVILDVRCPVLATAFRNEMKEKITGVMEIKDCDPGHFSDFLYFIYSGELDTLSTENVFTLFTLADMYDIQDLKSLSLDFIKGNLTIETFCETISLALLHCVTDLIKTSTEFFAKNMKEIILTVKWQSFILENPIRSNELLIKALNINNDGGR